MMDRLTILQGDALAQLATLPDASAQCCVTSPPYWGLRDYGHAGQLGLEKTPEEYVSAMVEVFREVRRVLKDDGTLWLNLGDSYANEGKGNNNGRDKSTLAGLATQDQSPLKIRHWPAGCKRKDLVGIPWMVAFALRADGWYLRSDIIWHKPNPMPESVTDRPTKSHEYLFLLTKSQRYYYDAGAISEPLMDYTAQRIRDEASRGMDGSLADKYETVRGDAGITRCQQGARAHLIESGRNKRSVWTVTTQPFPDAHFATYPPDLIKPCILAGSKPGDTILDPFGGSGTTGMVALELGRKAVLIELNPEYCKLIERRCDVTPGLAL